MVRNRIVTVGIIGCLVIAGFGLVDARTGPGYRPAPPSNAMASPAYCNTFHHIGKIALGVSNDGTFATQLSVGGSTRDCFTSETLPSAEYPKGSRTSYVFGGALWIGAVLGRDTLVSTGADGWDRAGNEYHPEAVEFGGQGKLRSNLDPNKKELFEGAISQEDYVCKYADTCTSCNGVSNDASGRGHIPLNIEVSQNTYAWSYDYADDFVLFDYGIKNIGRQRLHDIYMGFYVDADIHDLAEESEGAQDDLNGFRKWQAATYLPAGFAPDSDEVNLAWTADNDGGLDQDIFSKVPHITAMRIVRTPSDSLKVSFNWWVSNGDSRLDYGPQSRAKVRDFGTGGSGTPEGDRNKFFILSNGEFDFDQATCAIINELDPVWVPPPADRKRVWPLGLDTRYVLSFGPFDIEPGQTLPITLAYVAGENFHTDPNNFNNLPDNPQAWYEGVDFSSLGKNATWAGWVYDNPGVDTDSDGYRGEFRVRNLGGDSTRKCDTIWDSSVTPPAAVDSICYWEYALADSFPKTGDGVPDFRGAEPPPAPCLYSTTDEFGNVYYGQRVEQSRGKFTVRWNGARSETFEDPLLFRKDFEGYKVYLALDQRDSSYSIVASWDLENYALFDWIDPSIDTTLPDTAAGAYRPNTGSPFTLRELRCRFAPDGCDDTTWHPLDNPRSHPLVEDGGPGDTLIHYFQAQGYNQSILANYPNAQTEIRKVYPDAPVPPVVDADSIRARFPDGAWQEYLTDSGFIKFFEYEWSVDGLLPTRPYWVSVTAFDFGSSSSGIDALESSRSICGDPHYPLDAPDLQNPDANPVFVWPNPYRHDGDYRGLGFEGRGFGDRPADYVRLIHFGNLPERCTISIYSLDGDLVRQFEHPNPTLPSGCATTPNEDCWDLITRNTQQVVSGLYYWTVEDDKGNMQVGKLAIIM
ncbi:MAG: hypothetical protein AB1772_06785 [Candidatus Zixiibacteriota bacterium]